MNCWNSAFNAQGSGVIIVVVKIGSVKKYVAEVNALSEKEREDETTHFTRKIGRKTSLRKT